MRRTYAGFAALLALFLATPSVASAGGESHAEALRRAEAECPMSHVCFWSQDGFRGIQHNYKDPKNPNCANINYENGRLTEARSIFNHDDQIWRLHTSKCEEQPNNSGLVGKIYPNTGFSYGSTYRSWSAP